MWELAPPWREGCISGTSSVRSAMMMSRISGRWVEVGRLKYPPGFHRDIYEIFMHPLRRNNVPLASLVSERAMYQLSAVGIGAVSVAFFLVILAGLVREMTRHKRRKS